MTGPVPPAHQHGNIGRQHGNTATRQHGNTTGAIDLCHPTLPQSTVHEDPTYVNEEYCTVKVLPPNGVPATTWQLFLFSLTVPGVG